MATKFAFPPWAEGEVSLAATGPWSPPPTARGFLAQHMHAYVGEGGCHQGCTSSPLQMPSAYVSPLKGGITSGQISSRALVTGLSLPSSPSDI